MRPDLVIIAALLALGAPALAQERTKTVGGAAMYPSKSIVENAVNSKDHTTLVAAVKAAGLVDTLQGAGPFTVFAPTDKAFARMPAAELHALLEDAAALHTVLAFHIVPDRVRAPLVGRPASAVTIDGRTLTLTHENGEYRVGDVRIVKTNIRASNGLIHAINAVLLPR